MVRLRYKFYSNREFLYRSYHVIKKNTPILTKISNSSFLLCKVKFYSLIDYFFFFLLFFLVPLMINQLWNNQSSNIINFKISNELTAYSTVYPTSWQLTLKKKKKKEPRNSWTGCKFTAVPLASDITHWPRSCPCHRSSCTVHSKHCVLS